MNFFKHSKIENKTICPYCDFKLEKIPLRKSKCPNCKKYIYSRMRFPDRKKILLTENQKEKVVLDWLRFNEANGDLKIMKRDEYAITENELKKRFGREPNIRDIKWDVYNKRVLKYALERRWGSYRCNTMDMANLLRDENKLIQAMSTMFQVIYTDINGSLNSYSNARTYMSEDKIESLGIKEFDTQDFRLAPYTIKFVKKIIVELKMSEKKAKDFFTSTNKKTKPSKNMPISEEDAWIKFKKEIF